jgi:hypothetical protein
MSQPASPPPAGPEEGKKGGPAASRFVLLALMAVAIFLFIQLQAESSRIDSELRRVQTELEEARGAAGAARQEAERRLQEELGPSGNVLPPQFPPLGQPPAVRQRLSALERRCDELEKKVKDLEAQLKAKP